MNRSSQLKAVFAAFLFTLGFSTSGVLANTIAADVGISTISPCPSFCGGPGGSFDSTSDGGEGVSSAMASISNPQGNGQGFARLDGPTLLPVLGAEAFSQPNARVGVGATGQRPFVYTGSGPTDITLDFTFDGEASATNPSDAQALASIAVIRGSDIPFFTTDFGTLVFEVVPGSFGLEVISSTQVSLPVNEGPQSVPGSLDVSLAPGDNFFVWANVTVSGTRGGFVDALNTLNVQFSDPTGIVPVPEPNSIFLAALGLVGMTTVHRKWRFA